MLLMQVADVCIQAALDDAASNKVAEVVAEDARGTLSRLISTQFLELWRSDAVLAVLDSLVGCVR